MIKIYLQALALWDGKDVEHVREIMGMLEAVTRSEVKEVGQELVKANILRRFLRRKGYGFYKSKNDSVSSSTSISGVYVERL